jgi:hypothetical protein
VPGDFSVDSVRVEAANRLLVSTTVAGEGVDGADPGDLLSPECWVLSGQSDRAVALVESLSEDADSVLWRLTLTADLIGTTASLGLAAQARSSTGHVTDTTPLAFDVPPVLPVVDAVAGIQAADVAVPLLADETGDLTVLGAVDALRQEIRDVVIGAKKGAFQHLPDDGRAVEPKRNYSEETLRSEAARIKASIAKNPAVKTCSVSVSNGAGYAEFQIYVVPTTGPAFTETRRIQAGVT